MARLNRHQMERLRKEVKVKPIDSGGFGSREFRVEIAKPIERRVFEDAMHTEFGFQLKNNPTEKCTQFFLRFDWRKKQSNIQGRVIDRLLKIGHLEVK